MYDHYRKEVVVMATTHNTTTDVPTDTRLSWPNWYSWITGMVILICGAFSLKGLPIIPIIMLTLAVLVLWGLRRYGTWKDKKLLKRLPTWYAWKTAIFVFIVGAVGVTLGSITGTWMTDFLGALGLFGVIFIFLISVMATAGLLLAVSYRARKMRVVALACLLIVSIFLPQFGVGVSQTPAEQTRQVCADPAKRAMFPNECS